MSVQQSHFGWDKIAAIIGGLAIPVIGLIVTVTIGFTRLTDGVNVLTGRVDKIEEKVNSQGVKIDSIGNRQERYHYETNSQIQELKNQKRR